MIAVYKINISLLKRLLKFACFCLCVEAGDTSLVSVFL